MLIRKAAFLASLLASVFGASSAEAGIFGKRNCCQATPIVCPPSAPSVTTPQWVTPNSCEPYNLPSECVVRDSNLGDLSPSTFSLTDSLGLPQILIEQQVTRTVIGPGGIAEQRTETVTRQASDAQALRIVNQKIDTLNEKVFGSERNPSTPLEQRLKKLEGTIP